MAYNYRNQEELLKNIKKNAVRNSIISVIQQATAMD